MVESYTFYQHYPYVDAQLSYQTEDEARNCLERLVLSQDQPVIRNLFDIASAEMCDIEHIELDGRTLKYRLVIKLAEYIVCVDKEQGFYVAKRIFSNTGKIIMQQQISRYWQYRAPAVKCAREKGAFELSRAAEKYASVYAYWTANRPE